MNFLEIIEIRSSSHNMKHIGQKLAELVSKLNQHNENNTITLYNNTTVDNDFSIHILHHASEPDEVDRSVGERLFSILKEFGLTNYSSWTELSNGSTGGYPQSGVKK